ncbi:serine/threonine-protein kinase [Haliangium ochraceum]|uniref:Serine/threonine protein kinase n=1 Tax=Haliangium ochraceum (strain DSM 14365 / JCM 11303 / SMP-2) TaxID=502025 RepID=D0LJJ5_HALO1|nr:serine/threonine-protein kinase [Haliangium ochraceum]ACY16569.1 serine/threonine protein kinase [Haliangium ochraceum DSM 14365]
MVAVVKKGITVGMVVADTYEIVGLLGEGGMGSVWEARHTRLQGKRVAIKVLHAFASGDAEAFKRFEREANIATRLNHPNIVQVHDFNTLPSGEPYLILEYLQGENLAERLERGRMRMAEAMPIARQIGSALQAAHGEGIVHRDLKPHNIFLCPTETAGYAVEQVKVLDFGISKIRGSNTVQTQTSAILGTPQYMSPEQARGAQSLIDQRTDVFALGAIVYEMLAGKPAFRGDSIPEVLFKVVYEEPQPLAECAPGASPKVIAAVESALRKDLDERCESASAFIEALTGDPLVTLSGGPATAAVATPSVTPSMAAAAGGAMTGLAPGNAASVGREGQERAPTPAFDPTLAPNALGLAATGALQGAAAGATGSAGAGVPNTAPPLSARQQPAVAGTGGAGTHASQNQVAPGAAAASVDTAVPARKRGVLAWLVGGALLLGVAAAAAVIIDGSGNEVVHPSELDAGAADAATELAAETEPADAGTGAIAETEPADAAVAGDVVAAAADAAPRPVKDPPTPTTARPRGERLSPAQRKRLDEAAALIESKPDVAIRRAQATFQDGASERAYEIMTRAYCVKRDLGNAKGVFRNVKTARVRLRTRNFCRRHLTGFD